MRFLRRIDEEGVSPRLTLLLVGGLLFLVLAAAGLAGHAVREKRLAETEQRLRVLAQQRANQMVRTIDDWRSQVRFMSLTPPVAGLARAAASNGFDEQEHSSADLWRKRLGAIFSGFVASRQGVVRISYIATATGAELVRVDASDMDMGMADGGDGDAYLIPDLLHRDRRDAFVSDLELARRNKAVDLPRLPLLRVALAVPGPDGNMYGVLVIAIDARRLMAEATADLNPSLRFYAMNAREDFLIHPDAAQTFGWAFGQPHRWTEEFRPVDALNERSAMVSYETPDGLVHAVRHRVALDDNDPGRFLTIAVAVPDAMIETDVQTARLWVVTFGVILIGVVGLLLGFWRGSAQRSRRSRTRDAWLGAIVQSAHDAMIGLSRDGEVTSWNPAAAALFGIKADRALGRATTDLIVPPALAGEEADALNQVIRGTPVLDLTTRRRHTDGRIIDVSVSISPVHDQGRVSGAAMIIRDITGQVAAEQNIRMLNARLEQQVRDRTQEIESLAALRNAVLEHAGSGIIATDRSGTISLFNPAAERLLGHSAGELVGKATPAMLCDPAELSARRIDPAQGPGSFMAGAGQGGPDTREWTLLRKDGLRVPVLLAATALRDGGGTVTGYLAVISDLTAQRQVAERLREALTAAQSAARAKSAFLANMGHEIRTPLNGIVGSSHLLLREAAADSTQHVLAGNILRSATALSAIINDILDYSRIDAGLLRLNDEPFRLRDPLDGVVDQVAPDLKARNIALKLDLDPALPGHVTGDARRLRQILDNLVGNAAKFTHTGSVAIGVRQTGRAGGRVGLAIQVSDTGIGMSAHQTARLFQPFNPGDASHQRNHSGAGLGLALTYRLVVLMGGSIRVDSRQGQGSRFTIDLSLPVAADPAPLPPAPAAADVLSGARILVVEDNELNQMIARGFLQQAGAEVHLADDGAAAIACVTRAAFDLILMDVQMPGMDGLEATRAIRALPNGQAIPILALSAAVQESELQGCLDAGMNDHIPKPFAPEQLLSTLRRWLAGAVRVSGTAGDAGSKAPPAGGQEPAPEPGQQPAASPVIPGIDLEQAMGRVLGNRALLDSVLDHFAERFSSLGGRLKGRLAEGDWEQAARKLHDLRGAAGNIGAVEISRQASLLETALRRDPHDSELGPATDRLILEMEALCKAIRARPRAQRPPPAVPAGDAALDLDALRLSLRSRSLSALDILSRQEHALTDRLGADKVQALSKLVDGLRYGEALALLDAEFSL
ncbi:PAS domain S-box protein [Niveispirillum fermenti]|uniref:PAS domain S-box protein n=1 Tax=Niveispirillum fermenti TaxID=1233113 RepID=UPI003A88DF67